MGQVLCYVLYMYHFILSSEQPSVAGPIISMLQQPSVAGPIIFKFREVWYRAHINSE